MLNKAGHTARRISTAHPAIINKVLAADRMGQVGEGPRSIMDRI